MVALQSLPLIALFHQASDQFVHIVAEERLLPGPIDRGEIGRTLDHYTTFGGLPASASRAARNALTCVPRMVAADTKFSALSLQEQAQFFAIFHFLAPQLNRVARHEVEAEAAQALQTEGDQKTTLILDAGRDIRTIEESLGRDDRVIVVDNDPDVIRDLRAHFSRDSNQPDPHRLVLEETRSADPELMLRYAGFVDRVYFLYANDYSGAIAIFNALKRGGILVTQQTYDDEGQFTRELSASAEEFQLIRKFSDATPAYETPWSRVMPSGNVINIIRRNPKSRSAGRIFLYPRQQVGLSGGAGMATLEVFDLASLRR